MGYFFYANKIKFIMELNLITAKIGESYIIKDVCIRDEKLKRQIVNLGINKKNKIKLLKHNYNKSAILVEVMCVRYALDKLVCEQIKLYE